MDGGEGLLGAGDVRRLAAALGVAPTKTLGQNFVHDANTVRRIVRVAGVRPGERVLEVGPGLGSLTLGLLEAGAAVTAVEIDPRLAAGLAATAAERLPEAAGRLDVVTGDAIRVDVPGVPARLVANLPYNVAVPILLRLLADLPSLAAGVVMVQAEVGERLAADPGSKVYGVPSVKGAWYGRFALAGTVPRGVFWPVPNVDSVLVRFERGEPRGDEALRLKVFRLVDAAFAQRRKTLRQALAPAVGGPGEAERLLEGAGIDPSRRGESLGIDDWVALGRS
ncbi:16S rRNA (adenine(1518)-N(6)/adenine(1519)-N(6))-dimethyltransferase RsmA [Amnibacterium endophyticum]|uniref:Ribosomal RNA small subunit methyltransferase A n=1 Tax=Amnibacterium endophyticum TaxID=2109337 RepID=A0ABW4LEK7_9MICO